MKKILLPLVLIIVAISSFAQVPQAFKYQTVVRDNTGEILSNHLVSFQIGIMRDSLLLAPSYYEIHTKQTNELGLVSLEIGNGTVMYGQFDTINWGSKDYHLEIGLDINGGASYTLIGTTQLLAVPYALYSENTGNTDDNDWQRNGSYIFTLTDSVGIGTDSPGAKLDVTGPIWQSNIGQSIFLGEEAGANDNMNYNYNVFVGYQAGKSNTDGSFNTFIGQGCGKNNISGSGNVFLGQNAGLYNTDGYENTFIGRTNSVSNMSGMGNVVVGNSANNKNLAGSKNTIIGYQAGSNINDHSKSGNVFIGHRAGAMDTTDNKLYIANSWTNPSNTLIYGEFDNDILALNADVGIRTVAVDVPLHVGGGSDAGLTGGGYLVTGLIESTNLVLDDNEIVARNNGNVAYLFVNRDGGNVIINQFDGNVGIGTVSPAAKLHVDGTMRLGSGVRNYEILEVDPSYPDGWSSLINYGGIGIGSDDGGNRQMFMFTDGSNSDNIFTIATSQNNGSSWESDLVFTQGGNLGIGTISPGSKLDVTGPIWQSEMGGTVALGKFAGFNDDSSDNFNVFIGRSSGFSNISGIGNSYIGGFSGENNTGGYHNTSVGYISGHSNTTGFFNSNVGAYSNHFNQTGAGNTILGYAAGMGASEHSKSYNVFIGYRAGFYEISDNRLYIENSDVGPENALIYGEFDNDILAFNANVGIGTISPSNKLHVVGSIRMEDGNQGSGKIMISDANGKGSWADATSISDGDWSRNGNYVYTLNDSIGIGTNAPGAPLEVTGHIWQTGLGDCVFVGYQAGRVDDGTDNENVFIGNNAGYSNTSGNQNTFIGHASGLNSVSQLGNTFIGRASGYNSNSTGNTFIGANCGYTNSSGSSNTFIGYWCGHYNNGSDNLFVGNMNSFYSTGNFNTTLGSYADFYNTAGNKNTIMGFEAGFGSSGNNKSGNILLGYQAGYNESGSNKLYIENSNASSADALIYGEFDNNILVLNASVGIGTTNPGKNLEISNTEDAWLRIAGDSDNSGGDNGTQNAYLQFTTDGNNEGYDGLIWLENLSGDTKLHFDVEDQEVMVFSDGRVGVGTNTPASQISNSTTLSSDGSKTTATSGINWRVEDYGGYAVGIENIATGGSGLLVDAGNNAGTGATVAHFVSNNTSLMFIGENGNVGIGTTSPSQRLTVYNGSTTGTYTTSGWLHSSDARLKTNINLIENALEKVSEMEGVYFNWKDTDENHQVGLIAQEVEKVLPEVVRQDDKGYYSVSYDGVVPVLIEAIKELQQHNEKLEARIIELEKN